MATQSPVRTRPDQEPLPRRMQHLPIDPERGYVVPWFVDWLNGKPEFRSMDRKKWVMAIRQRLCWVCGHKLESRFAFVVGPMCGVNRTASEPPSHLECARWSARNCPFLSNPNMVRRQDDLINDASLTEKSAGFAITRNPGVTLVWITRGYSLFPDGAGQYLLMMDKPHEVEWYCRGRAATRAEIEESVSEGLIALENVARTEKGGLEALERQHKLFQKLLPKK